MAMVPPALPHSLAPSLPFATPSFLLTYYDSDSGCEIHLKIVHVMLHVFGKVITGLVPHTGGFMSVPLAHEVRPSAFISEFIFASSKDARVPPAIC